MSKNGKPSFVFSIRFLFVIILFFGYAFNFMQKIDMSIAIVCMTNHTAVELENQKHISLFNQVNNISLMQISNDDECPVNTLVSKKEQHDGEFVWDKKTKGFILSAYFYGYIFTQIPGGYLSYQFGGQYILCLSMFFGSFMTLLIPTFARISPIAHFICLLLTGVAHGAFWPSVSSFWAYWAPPTERSRMVGFSSTGSRMGNVFALSMGGYLCIEGFAGGWPSIFYIFGIMGMTWSVLFFIIASNSPRDQHCISNKEREYILDATRKSIETRAIIRSRVPWFKIITSKACWAIFIGHFTHNWGNYLFMTQMPSYLRDVLKFDIKSNGLIASIPYIACSIFMIIFSFLSDKLLAANVLSKKNVRRIFIGIGTIVPCFFIIGLSFVTCNYVILGVVLLSLGVGFDSVMTGAGYLVNINDIAGPFSGIVFGISNTIGTIPGLIGPYIASVITSNQTQKEWQIVFLITAMVYLIGGSTCIFLLEATTQPWAQAGIKLTKLNLSDEDSDENISETSMIQYNGEKVIRI